MADLSHQVNLNYIDVAVTTFCNLEVGICHECHLWMFLDAWLGMFSGR